jgi:hypothetical protein
LMREVSTKRKKLPENDDDAITWLRKHTQPEFDTVRTKRYSEMPVAVPLAIPIFPAEKQLSLYDMVVGNQHEKAPMRG